MIVEKGIAKVRGSKKTADVLVIGSGFGGAVAADRLVKAGLKVRVLERGPWRTTTPVVAQSVGSTAPLPIQNRPGLILRDIRGNKGVREIRLNRRGLLELHVGRGVKTLASSGVGGGSHVWAALVTRPEDPEYWNDLAAGLSEAIMAPHYERVQAELGATHPVNAASLPNHTSYAWQGSGWFEPVAESEQYPFAFLFPEQNGGRANANRELSELNGEDGMFGSPRASKATVDVVYLLPNLDAGLTVHDMHEVKTIARTGTGVYEITAKDHHSGAIKHFQAPQVVLAAGTMNSVKILSASLESRGLSPIEQLGKGFGTNGDCMSLWAPGIAQCNSRLGSPIHGRLKTSEHPQDVNLIIGGMDAIPLPKWAPGQLKAWVKGMAEKRFQLIAMGVDRADGSISFFKGRLKLEYDLNNSPVYQSIFTMFDRLAKRSNTRIEFDQKTAVTAHAMGGCRIGRLPSEGVVDGEGQVFGNPGLFISDASVLPVPTGCPPSLTISAWGSHVASSMLNHR